MDTSIAFKCNDFNWNISFQNRDWINAKTFKDAFNRNNKANIKNTSKTNVDKAHMYMSFLVVNSRIIGKIFEKCQDWSEKDLILLKHNSLTILFNDPFNEQNKLFNERHVDAGKAIHIWLFIIKDKDNDEIFFKIRERIDKYVNEIIPILMNDYIKRLNNANKIFDDILKSTEEADNSDECAMCMENYKPHIKLMPCGHSVLCDLCSNVIIDRHSKCVICREKIVNYVVI